MQVTKQFHSSEHYQRILRNEFLKRREKNARFSLRSFARTLHLSSGAISQILSGKRIPSFKTAKLILEHLSLSPEEQKLFWSSLAHTQQSRRLKRLDPAFQSAPELLLEQKELSQEMFAVISDWYHYAILELTHLPDFKAQDKWIAKKLGIGLFEAKAALDRLFTLGLLVEKEGSVCKSSLGLTTADKHLSSMALRRRQKQVLEMAIESLENDPIEIRNHSSMTMAIDPDKIPLAKQMIREFNRLFCQTIGSGELKQVYELGITFYPISKKNSNKHEEY